MPSTWPRPSPHEEALDVPLLLTLIARSPHAASIINTNTTMVQVSKKRIECSCTGYRSHDFVRNRAPSAAVHRWMRLRSFYSTTFAQWADLRCPSRLVPFPVGPSYRCPMPSFEVILFRSEPGSLGNWHEFGAWASDRASQGWCDSVSLLMGSPRLLAKSALRVFAWLPLAPIWETISRTICINPWLVADGERDRPGPSRVRHGRREWSIGDANRIGQLAFRNHSWPASRRVWAINQILLRSIFPIRRGSWRERAD